MTRDHSSRFYPDEPIPPRETLAEMIEEREISRTDLAERMGVELEEVHRLLDGEADATFDEDVILRLAQALPVSAQFWRNRERSYRTILARDKAREGIA